LNLLLK
jgi:glycine/D-amino acid oxidase-like deaminating enzyme